MRVVLTPVCVVCVCVCVCYCVSGSNTMALLEKLEPGNIYLVKICAANQFGDGPYSSLVDVALPRASGHRSKNPRHSDSFAEPPGKNRQNTKPTWRSWI